jgi:hypothetical protein
MTAVNTYPPGNVVLCRFGFPSRPLTDAELATFAAGGGFPAGVTGQDPPVVKFDYQPPGNTTVSLTGGQITKDAVGQYHAPVSIPITAQPGEWRYRGRGENNDQTPIAATDWTIFYVG